MATVKTVLILTLILYFYPVSGAPSYQDILNFYTNAITCTTCFVDEIFPKKEQSDQITVDVNFTLVSIGEFNEADGYLEVNGLMDITWDDDLISAVSGPPFVTEISVPRDVVWVPTISIFNSHSNISMIGDANTDVRISMPTKDESAVMKWSPSIVSKTNCQVDSTYFPFDTQKCNITFTPWGFKDSEVNISITNESLDTSYYNEHELWRLKSHDPYTETKESTSFAHFELTLQRNPKYFLLTHFLPFLMLVFLSNLIFLVPAGSGERVGFAMFVFLSISILMAMVTGSLPKSSTQMSILSFYFTTMILVVSVLTYLAILSLTIHSKDPRNMVPQRIVRFIACCGCYENKHKHDLSRQNKVTPLTLSEYDDNDDNFFSHPKFQTEYEEDFAPIVIRKDDKVYKNDYEITWKHVARTFDKICFVVFIIVNFLLTMIFMTPLLAHYYQ